MRKQLSVVFAATLAALTIAAPALAEVDSLTREQILSHPEVAGAIAAIDAHLEGVHIYEKVPGISAGIVYDQELIWQSGYGYANLESKRPADVDTLYSICSISKLFTAIGIMQLRDAGELTLRDSVGEHLEWFNIHQAHDDSGPVNIESLLTHSSGLPRESDYPYWNGPDFPFPSRAQIIDRLSVQETLYPAQHYFQYSNLALTLAGEIVQQRSGQDYAEYTREQILDPLGLSDTRTYYPVELRGEQLAIGYTGLHRSGTRDPVAPFFARGITAAAGFTSSVNDLAKFASWQFRLLQGGDEDVLAANTLREMQRVHWVDPDWETTWGLGFSVTHADDMTVVGHGGGCPGYITDFLMVPKQKLAVIVLTNAGDGPAGRSAMNILMTIGPALKTLETPVEDDRPDFSMYEGNYESRPWGGEVAVRQWGDELAVIDIPDDDLKESIIKLEFDGDHTFTRLADDGDRREPWVFELDKDGKTSRIFRHSTYLTRID